jgi:hypothetical protein
MSLDFNKPIVTRYGRDVVILGTDFAGAEFPVRGYIVGEKPKFLRSWGLDGAYSNRPHELDLYNSKPRIQRTVYLNVYDNHTMARPSREKADLFSEDDRRACIKVDIDCEEGEGL